MKGSSNGSFETGKTDMDKTFELRNAFVVFPPSRIDVFLKDKK